ncbi:hypothetical protein C942_04729 [Photobacterium marinum]|uniref:Uncharacterized protein n=1 Tax=Photobacterium marinum TaxID=1056511 RepID=L8J2J1_9GAMM|nr:hypothetical protein [Photobacterium marinum]ELR63080.1 hypothetical protein C942_04729 [Photobacterium marinum]
MDLRIYQDDSEAIGFVIAALFSQAINLAEMQKWAESVIMDCDDYPDYIIDLIGYSGFLKDIYTVIGFYPASSLSDRQYLALVGIADIRGIDRFDTTPSKVDALAALKREPEILKRFIAEFPFTELCASDA